MNSSLNLKELEGAYGTDRMQVQPLANILGKGAFDNEQALLIVEEKQKGQTDIQLA